MSSRMTNDVQITAVNETGFIDEKELVARLKVSRGSVVNYRNRGLLPFVRLGRSVRYHWPTVQSTLLRQQRIA
jgi:hypothetical protein